MIDLSKYKNKKVFITGHTGFKGGWLLAILNKEGAIVKGYALAAEHKNGIYNTINGDNLCESIISDIRDYKKLEDEILEFQPDFIFHLAAQSLVRTSYESPSETFEINVLGTSYLLASLRKLNKKCVTIIITTDKVYENNEAGIAYGENDRLGGFDPYSSSKACAELVTASYKTSFFSSATIASHQQEIATVRAGNVIGGGDFSKDRIIPDLINSLMKGEKLKIRKPNSIRPWQHVLEPLIGYLTLGLMMENNSQSYSPSYNFGPEENDHLPVIDLVKEAIEVWGSGTWEIIKQDSLHEAGILKLDISLAKNELKWKPRFSSKQAIQQTLEWYRAENPTELTYNQIENYLNL